MNPNQTAPRNSERPGKPEASSELDHRLDAALAAAPAVVIPADFAARVASLAPTAHTGTQAAGTLRSPRPHVARLALWAGALLLLAAMVAFAIASPQGTAAVLAQSLLVLEFTAFVLVGALRPRLLR